MKKYNNLTKKQKEALKKIINSLIDEENDDCHVCYLHGISSIQKNRYFINLEYKNLEFLVKQELFKKGYKYKEVLDLSKKLNIMIKPDHDFDEELHEEILETYNLISEINKKNN